jgi:hypothetical protein
MSLEHSWNDNERGRWNYREKNCPNATLPATDLTRTVAGWNLTKNAKLLFVCCFPISEGAFTSCEDPQTSPAGPSSKSSVKMKSVEHRWNDTDEMRSTWRDLTFQSKTWMTSCATVRCCLSPRRLFCEVLCDVRCPELGGYGQSKRTKGLQFQQAQTDLQLRISRTLGTYWTLFGTVLYVFGFQLPDFVGQW